MAGGGCRFVAADVNSPAVFGEPLPGLHGHALVSDTRRRSRLLSCRR